MQGHALYYGPAASTDEWFDRLGYRLPYRVNVADFILDISSGDVFREDRCSPPAPHRAACMQANEACQVSLVP